MVGCGEKKAEGERLKAFSLQLLRVLRFFAIQEGFNIIVIVKEGATDFGESECSVNAQVLQCAGRDI
jgi:hypothetical protein